MVEKDKNQKVKVHKFLIKCDKCSNEFKTHSLQWYIIDNQLHCACSCGIKQVLP